MVRRWAAGDGTAPRPDPDPRSCALASGGLLRKNDRSSCVEAGCASAATTNRIPATSEMGYDHLRRLEIDEQLFFDDSQSSLGELRWKVDMEATFETFTFDVAACGCAE